MRKNPISNPPSSKLALAQSSEECRARAEARLFGAGKTWNWLAIEIESEGYACRATIAQWSTGRKAQIGCGVYVAVLSVLDRLERRVQREKRAIRSVFATPSVFAGSVRIRTDEKSSEISSGAD